MSERNGTAPEGTRTTVPPEGTALRVGFGPATRKSAALGDEAAAEIRRLRVRLRELRDEQTTILAEIVKLQGVTEAVGIEYQEDA